MKPNNLSASAKSTIVHTSVLVFLWIVIGSLMAVATSGYERGEGWIGIMLAPLLPIYSVIVAIRGIRLLRLKDSSNANKTVGTIATIIAVISMLIMIVVLFPK